MGKKRRKLFGASLKDNAVVGTAVKGEGTLRGLLEAADQADEGGLARAVAAYEAVDGSLFHVHGQAVEGLSVLIMLD